MKGDDIGLILFLKDVLHHLHKWYNQLQSLPPHYLTPYGIVSVSTAQIAERVIPKLLSIQKQVETEVIDKVRMLCVTILKKVKLKSEVTEPNLNFFFESHFLLCSCK